MDDISNRHEHNQSSSLVPPQLPTLSFERPQEDDWSDLCVTTMNDDYDGYDGYDGYDDYDSSSVKMEMDWDAKRTLLPNSTGNSSLRRLSMSSLIDEFLVNGAALASHSTEQRNQDRDQDQGPAISTPPAPPLPTPPRKSNGKQQTLVKKQTQSKTKTKTKTKSISSYIQTKRHPTGEQYTQQMMRLFKASQRTSQSRQFLYHIVVNSHNHDGGPLTATTATATASSSSSIAARKNKTLDSILWHASRSTKQLHQVQVHPKYFYNNNNNIMYEC